MPYGTVLIKRGGNRVLIQVELPNEGEPSDRGRADNLVDPRAWHHLEDENDVLNIKVTVCRPYRRRASWESRPRRLA